MRPCIPAELHSDGPWYRAHAVGEERMTALQWFFTLSDHFKRTCWLNPDKPQYWYGTVEEIRAVFEMFPLTLEGLSDAIQHLSRGARPRPLTHAVIVAKIPAVGAVIFEGDRVCLIQRGQAPLKGAWSLPGGRVEPGESHRDALVREIFEETGLVIEVGPPDRDRDHRRLPGSRSSLCSRRRCASGRRRCQRRGDGPRRRLGGPRRQRGCDRRRRSGPRLSCFAMSRETAHRN